MISIISVNYNNAPFTASCVTKTMMLLNANAIPFEYLIVDNKSTDNSFQYLLHAFENYDQVKVLDSKKNGGFGFGNNVGATHARFDILWFLNSDAWCTKFGGIAALVKVIAMRDTGIVSNIMKDIDGTVHPNGGASLTFKYLFMASFRPGLLFRKSPLLRTIASRIFGKSDYINARLHDQIDQPIEREIVSGASFFIEKDKYQSLGGFDESFFLYDEDTDLCYRAKQSGLRNYVAPYAEVMTINHSTTSKISSIFLKQIKYQSRIYLIRKHFTGLKRIVLFLITRLTWRLL
jgi:N-acetylglucosaminyl-diphospho-decaprenol L-rhamnosyltransferase